VAWLAPLVLPCVRSSTEEQGRSNSPRAREVKPTRRPTQLLSAQCWPNPTTPPLTRETSVKFASQDYHGFATPLVIEYC